MTHVQKTAHRYKVVLIITALLALLQTGIFAFVARSVSLEGDALHSIIDCFIIYGSMRVVLFARSMTKEERKKKEEWWDFIAILSLIVSAALIGWEGWNRIHISHSATFNTTAVIGVSLLSLLGNLICYNVLKHIHKDHCDTKREVNIIHIAADFGMSLIVLVSTACVIFFKTAAFDGYGALVLALGLALLSLHIASGHKH